MLEGEEMQEVVQKVSYERDARHMQNCLLCPTTDSSKMTRENDLQIWRWHDQIEPITDIATTDTIAMHTCIPQRRHESLNIYTGNLVLQMIFSVQWRRASALSPTAPPVSQT